MAYFSRCIRAISVQAIKHVELIKNVNWPTVRQLLIVVLSLRDQDSTERICSSCAFLRINAILPLVDSFEISSFAIPIYSIIQNFRESTFLLITYKYDLYFHEI